MRTKRKGEPMVKVLVGVLVLLLAFSTAGQSPPPPGQPSAAAALGTPPATDVTAADLQTFIMQLPRDVISDRPIRVVDVGGYRVGVFGVFRPKSVKQDAVLHEVKTTEIYYMLDGAGTLVTGGTLVDERRESSTATTVRGSRIEGGVSRRVTKGDVVIIPGRVPHWWSTLEGDISYLIFRPDPENRLQLR